MGRAKMFMLEVYRKDWVTYGHIRGLLGMIIVRE